MMESYLKKKANGDASNEERTSTKEEGNSSQVVNKNKNEETTIYQSPRGESSTFVSNSESGMLSRWEQNAPYYIFYTAIPESPATLEQKNAITFTDILCPSLGKLKETLQITFMVDVDWLMKQYEARNIGSLPMTIIYDRQYEKKRNLHKFPINADHHRMSKKRKSGSNHSKIGIYVYDDDSLRVVVSTADLHHKDWNHYNQGLWLSPRLPLMSETSADDGESPTKFKYDLLDCLGSYWMDCLKPWIERVKKTDFSQISVFLVTSTPGKHVYSFREGCHILTVGKLLQKYCNVPESEVPIWSVLAQSSSIDSLGKSAENWLRPIFLKGLAARKAGSSTEYLHATLKFVYPTVDNVKNGYFGQNSGGCLLYTKEMHEQQEWFHDYLHHWKAERLHRSRAMPHITSYTRVSPCYKKLTYYLLTSANLSQGAWGRNNMQDECLHIESYEAGVLFLPEFFGEEYFEIDPTLSSKSAFPFMYDLPLTRYNSDENPWCTGC